MILTASVRTGARAGSAALALLLAAGGLPAGAHGQDSLSVTEGVELGLLYRTDLPVTLAVRPFLGMEPEAPRVAPIVERDLDLSDRFTVLEAPASLAAGHVEFLAWDGLGVDYVVDGILDPADHGSNLQVVVHDVVYASVLKSGVFRLPPSASPGFRMAVHGVSDEIVRWITGERGVAASRVVFPRGRADGGYDLMVVDADGEGLTRVAAHERLAFSPTWSPDGRRVAYTAMADDGSYDVWEHDLGTGQSRGITPRKGLNMTPAYSADGARLGVAISTGSREDLYEYEPGSGRLHLLTARAMEPSFAPNGRWVAFSSDRLGSSQIWVMPLGGGDPILASPWVASERIQYNAPDWSPDGRLVAYHGGRSLRYQILAFDAEDPAAATRQLTWEGWSEAPSWAPDARHVVLHGSRDGREGLYVLDAVTGRTRLLVSGSGVRTPDWSPVLTDR